MNLTQPEFQAILRNDFASFIERAFYELNPQTEFIPGAYIELLAAKLEQVRRGDCKRLIINIPPRTLKSHTVSVAFPAWLLGHAPSTQILCASYGQDLAGKHARDCRTLMSSGFYRSLFPQTALSIEKKAVEDFTTTKQGFRLSVSVGGPITGRGADIIILDDPLKPEDALSDVQRKKTNEWFSNTLLSRLNSKANGAIIIVMQRLHEDDLVGAVLSREPWEVLSLPAFAIESERHEFDTVFGPQIFTRRAGEVLHPERDSLETYMAIRESIGQYNFNSQYQQTPIPRDGGILKREWIKYYPHNYKLHKFRMIIQSWDTASKVEDNNAYSVCTTWGVYHHKMFLLHVFRQRLEFPALKKAVLALHETWKPHKVIIEDKASGTALIQELKTAGMRCIEAYQPAPGSDKFSRFAVQTIKFEAGEVFLPNQAPWLDEFVREITGFPGSKFADQVDSTSQALDFVASKMGRLSIYDVLDTNWGDLDKDVVCWPADAVQLAGEFA